MIGTMKQSKQEEKAPYIKEIEDRLRGVINLLVECMNVNKIKPSDMVSAMSALMLSIYASQKDSKLFYRALDAMKETFEMYRREK